MTISVAQVKKLLQSADIKPRKSLGQNFLVNSALLEFLVRSARIDPSSVVLEVGCGLGNLTQLLLQQAFAVVGVEIDAKLAQLAKDNVSDHNNLHLLVTDVLAKGAVVDKVLSLIDRLCRQDGPRTWQLVANLPYNVASPLLVELAYRKSNPPKSMSFTVQKEVADRLAAAPGCKAYGPLTVLIQAAGQVKILRRVGPAAFYPRPKVESAMVRIDLLNPSRFPIRDRDAFRTLVSRLFRHRRKTIQSGWIRKLPPQRQAAALEACKQTGIDVSNRPERVTVQQYISLSNTLAAEKV